MPPTFFLPQILVAMGSGISAFVFTVFTWKYSKLISNNFQINEPGVSGKLTGFITCWLIAEVSIAVFIASGLYYFQMYAPKIVVIP